MKYTSRTNNVINREHWLLLQSYLISVAVLLQRAPRWQFTAKCLCLSLTEDAVIAEIMLCDYTKALFSAVHWSILTVDTESLSPCGRVGSTIFVSTISSNHWFLRAKLQICHSCWHPPPKSPCLFSWDMAIHWKIPWVLQMNPAVTPNAKKPEAIEVNLWIQHLIFFSLCCVLPSSIFGS